MNFRNQSLEYYITPTREFCKKYKMSHHTATRRFGSKNNLSYTDKMLIVELSIKTGLLPNEVMELLQTHTATEIREGIFDMIDGKIIFKPREKFLWE